MQFKILGIFFTSQILIANQFENIDLSDNNFLSNSSILVNISKL